MPVSELQYPHRLANARVVSFVGSGFTNCLVSFDIIEKSRERTNHKLYIKGYLSSTGLFLPDFHNTSFRTL